MASQIEAIFDAIAAVSITVDGTALTGRLLADSGTEVNVTPARIISPLAKKDEGENAVQFTIGNQYTVNWTITDLLLFRPVKDGTGLEYNMPHLVDYMGKYIDAIRANNKLSFAKHVAITSAKIEVGVYEYPVGSENWYYGCMGTLKVTEIIP
jgi:hypothetical protein